MEFHDFKALVKNHFDAMVKDATSMFWTDVDKDVLWETYLSSFPAGTNNIFRERTEHDCSACRHFIKSIGAAVVIRDNQIHSIWELDCDDATYGPVCKALDAYVKSRPVIDAFFSVTKKIGVEKTVEVLNDGTSITWEHFAVDVPDRFVINPRHTSIGTLLNEKRTLKAVFKRSLDEISNDTVETVLELIGQNSLYRGTEWQSALTDFLKYKKLYEKVSDDLKDNFAWVQSAIAGPVVGKIRNHSIGTLLLDIETGVDLDTAVTRYECVVAPANYKRPKAIFTKKMLEDAKKTIQDLGYMDSLPRRFATLDDITINNILFADRNAAKRIAGDVFSEMADECSVSAKKFDRAASISAEEFVKNVLPTASGVELLLEGRHTKNMVSLIAPVNGDAPSMFKWGNPFSWAYTGNIADSSIRENVKSAGGKVDGVLRFSIQWNDGDSWDQNDEDAHCKMPGYHIYYGMKLDPKSGGNLDVDIIHPHEGKPAVENITWPSLSRMPDGDYSFYVNCYAARGGKSGFRAEIEFDGQVFQYDYNHPMRNGQNVSVAVVHKKNNEFTIDHKLPCGTSSVDVWSVKTNQFIPVSVVMYSPNYWDDQDGIGNKHYFFMLKGCVNPENPNGFYNEYLKQELVQHRRVFEALGGKMSVESVDDQLSGVGFSSTLRNDVIVRVKGKTDRVLKVVF